MKLTTEVFARFESKGYPNKTKQMAGTINQVILGFAKWITSDGLYLNTNIRFTIARTEAELDIGSKRGSDNELNDMEAQLAALLDSSEESLDEPA